MRLTVLLSAALVSMSLHAATVEVQVTDASGAAVADAVVYAIPPAAVPVGHKVASMDQINREFVPHILPIQTGTWVEFPNSDNIRHQVYSPSPAKKFSLPLYTGKPAFPVQFNAAGIVALGCNIHEQMSAYVVVVDTPYFAKTQSGRATIKDLPEGQYAFRVWYPEMKDEPKAQTVTLAAGDHPSITFTTGKKK